MSATMLPRTKPTAVFPTTNGPKVKRDWSDDDAVDRLGRPELDGDAAGGKTVGYEHPHRPATAGLRAVRPAHPVEVSGRVIACRCADGGRDHGGGIRARQQIGGRGGTQLAHPSGDLIGRIS